MYANAQSSHSISDKLIGAVGIPPAPISDVQAQVHRLEEAINRMDAVCLNLISQLSPVLRPAGDAKSQAPSTLQTVPTTELARQIGGMASHVDSLRDAVQDAFSRLGI